MEETNDKLIDCSRCGSNCCQETQISPEVKNLFCLGCGYQCCTAMKKDNEFFKEQMDILPNIYKELSGEDEKGNIWIPSYTMVKDKGIVFMSGTNTNDAKWAAVKAEDMKEGKWKAETIVYFEESDYMDALSYINVLPG